MQRKKDTPILHGGDHGWRSADPIMSDWTYVGDTDAPDFQNGWVNAGGDHAPMRFKFLPATDSDSQLPVVELQGSVEGGVLGSTIFTLPMTWDYDTHHPVTDNVGFYSVLTVKKNGDVIWGID